MHKVSMILFFTATVEVAVRAVAPWVSCFGGGGGGQEHHFSDKQIFCDITNSVVRKCSFD